MQTNPPLFPNFGGWTSSTSVNARQPLFNLGNVATIRQAERSLESAQADLEWQQYGRHQ